MFANAKTLAIGMFAAMASAPLLLQAPAQAAACPTSSNTNSAPTTAANYITATTLFGTSGFSCTLGDKIFSNFANATSTITNTATGIRFWWDSADTEYFLRWGVTGSGTGSPITASSGGTVYGFDFKVAIDPLLAPLNYISNTGYNRTGGNTPSNLILNVAETATPPIGPATSISYVTSATLTGTTSNTRAFQIQISQDQVPGPLPILGAGMAFGYSRKLRKRTRRLA